MTESTVKIGYCPTRRKIFSKTAPYDVNKKIIAELNQLDPHVKIVYGSDCPENDLLDNDDTAEQMIEHFKREKIDGLLLAACNFGSEVLSARVAKALNVPVLLWGPRDDAPDERGLRERDSQCGVFAAGKVFRHYNIPFTYLISSHADSDYFREGVVRFAAVCNVVSRFRSMRILQISTRPTPFMSVICSEGELLEKFGIEIIPIALNDLLSMANSMKDQKQEEVLTTADTIRNLVQDKTIDEDHILTMASVKAALKALIKQYRCTAAAVQCWDAFYQLTGTLPCIANALLADEGIPVACETDVCGAVSAALLQAATFDSNPQFFADVTVRHPENDQAELLWHCGPFPYSLHKTTCSGCVGRSYTLENRECGICEWELKDGEITVIRFDGDHGKYSMFIGEAVTTEGPYNRGTYVWIKVNNWEKWGVPDKRSAVADK